MNATNNVNQPAQVIQFKKSDMSCDVQGQCTVPTGVVAPPAPQLQKTSSTAQTTDASTITGGNYNFSHTTPHDNILRPLFDALITDTPDKQQITQLTSALVTRQDAYDVVNSLLTQLEHEWENINPRTLLQLVAYIREQGKSSYLGNHDISFRCSYLVRDLLGDDSNSDIVDRLDDNRKLCRTIERNINEDIDNVSDFVEVWGHMYKGGHSDADYGGMKWAENIRGIMQLVMTPVGAVKLLPKLISFIRKTPKVSTSGILTKAKELLGKVPTNKVKKIPTRYKVAGAGIGVVAVGHGISEGVDAVDNYIYDKDEELAKNNKTWVGSIHKALINQETPEDFATTFKTQTQKQEWDPDKEKYGILDMLGNITLAGVAGFMFGGIGSIITAFTEFLYMMSSNELVDKTNAMADSINDTLGTQKETEDILFASISNALKQEDDWGWDSATPIQQHVAQQQHTPAGNSPTQQAVAQPVSYNDPGQPPQEGMMWNPYLGRWFMPGIGRSTLRAGISS